METLKKRSWGILSMTPILSIIDYEMENNYEFLNLKIKNSQLNKKKFNLINQIPKTDETIPEVT